MQRPSDVMAGKRPVHRCGLWISLVTLGGLLAVGALAATPVVKTRNVFLITADGLRWQEVFRGAEDLLISKENGGVSDVAALSKAFVRASPEARREALLPFFWSAIAVRGQVFGSQDTGSVARVTNGRNFSYPGYSELLVGYPDGRIESNDKIPNPNTNVLEWLHGRPGYRGKVAAFGCWDVFPSILNQARAGFPVAAGWAMVESGRPEREPILRVLRETTRAWDAVIYDAFMLDCAWHYLETERPRVLYLAFGETDDWAHDGRYDRYLQAAHNFDRSLGRLWQYVQSSPQYRDQTTLILTTDHGRGTGPVAWKNHGQAIAESAFIWMAVLGPDTPALGVRSSVEVKQSQIAATVAAVLGEDYQGAVPRAAPALPGVMR